MNRRTARDMNQQHALVERCFGYAVLLVSTGFFFLAVDAVLRLKGY